MSQQRLFVAVPAPPSTQSAVTSATQALRDECDGVRWVPPKNMHITLAFLGATNVEAFGGIVNAVGGGVERHECFDLELEGLGAFPDTADPVTLWLGISNGLRQLEALQRDVVDALEPLGFEGEARPYNAHLTLGRLRDQMRVAQTSSAIAAFASLPVGSMPVTRVGVFSSEILESGPRYDLLEAVPLASARHCRQ